jgi:hypothetical protein
MAPARLPRPPSDLEIALVCVALVTLAFMAGLSFNGCAGADPRSSDCHRAEPFKDDCRSAP